MKIWVDADACPKLIKDILFKAANRVQLPLILVANQYIPVPPSPYIRAVQVAAGFDVADNHIVQAVSAGELVITADIPLAAAVVAKQALALNPRGELYTRDNVGQRLTMRNLMDELRGSGIHTGGPAVMTPKDRQNFANQLDRWLAGLKR